MDRIAWITAACLIDWHGDEAVDVVQRRLNTWHEDCASRGELEYWCEIGRAVIEILRARREAGELAH